MSPTNKTLLLFLFASFSIGIAKAQEQAPKLPWAYYMTMINTCNSADIVLLQGEGGSVSIDQDNFGIVKEFIANIPAEKPAADQAASVMCLIDGKEFITGKVFVKGQEGAITFTVEGNEYSNLLSEKAVTFFRSLIGSM